MSDFLQSLHKWFLHATDVPQQLHLQIICCYCSIKQKAIVGKTFSDSKALPISSGIIKKCHPGAYPIKTLQRKFYAVKCLQDRVQYRYDDAFKQINFISIFDLRQVRIPYKATYIVSSCQLKAATTYLAPIQNLSSQISKQKHCKCFTTSPQRLLPK